MSSPWGGSAEIITYCAYFGGDAIIVRSFLAKGVDSYSAGGSCGSLQLASYYVSEAVLDGIPQHSAKGESREGIGASMRE